MDEDKFAYFLLSVAVFAQMIFIGFVTDGLLKERISRIVDRAEGISESQCELQHGIVIAGPDGYIACIERVRE